MTTQTMSASRADGLGAPPQEVAAAAADVRALLAIHEQGIVWHCITAITRLRVPDELVGGPRPVADLATAVGADEDALYRVLRLLSDHGVVTLDGDRVALTDRGRLLADAHPVSIRGVFAAAGIPDIAHALTETLRTGRAAAPAVFGTSFWEYLAARPAEQALFDAEMKQLARLVLMPAVPRLPWPSSGTIADIGGGIGTLIAAALRAAPGTRGILVDQPQVVEQAPGFLASMGVADRCEIHPGDLVTPPPPADLYLISRVLHNWGDEQVVRIFEAIGASATAETRLWVLEGLLPEDGSPHRTKWSDITMLALLDGARERSLGEFKALLERAGWRFERVVDTPGVSVIEARRA